MQSSFVSLGFVITLQWAILLLQTTSLRAQQAEPLRPPNNAVFNPSDVYYQGYLYADEAAQLEKQGRFAEALAKYRSAQTFFETVAKFHPEWKPEMVARRIILNQARVKDIFARAEHEMNINNIAVAELEGGVVVPIAPANKDLQAPIQANDPRLFALEEEVRRLRSALASPANQSTRDAARASEMQKQRNETQARLNQANQKLLDLRNELAAKPLQSELDSLNGRIRSLEQERQAMKQALDQSSERQLKSLATIESLSADLRATAKQMADLRSNLNIQREKNNQIVKGQLEQMKMLEETVKNKDLQLTAAKNQIASLQRELQETKDTVSDIQYERDTLLRDKAQLSALLKLSEEGRIQQLIEQNVSLAKELREAKERVDLLNKNAFQNADQLEEAKRDLGIAKFKIREFQADKRQQEESIQELRMRLEVDSKNLADGKNTSSSEEAETLRGVVKRQIKQLECAKQAAELLLSAAKDKIGATDDYRKALSLLDGEEIHLSQEEENALALRRIDGEIYSPYAASRDSVNRNIDAVRQQVAVYDSVAKRAFQDQRFSPAREVFEMILDLNPGDVVTMRKLGIVHLRLGDPSSAAKVLRNAVENDESQALSHRFYGLALYKEGSLDQAIESLRRCLDIQPQDSKAYTILGNAFYRQGNIAEAEAAYQSAIALSPHDHEALHNLALLFRHTNRMKDALVTYQESLKHGALSDPLLEALAK
jgi:Flp pilus assembly protein TadD/predicted  nucleic acid-binding Zn-ribbon protein